MGTFKYLFITPFLLLLCELFSPSHEISIGEEDYCCSTSAEQFAKMTFEGYEEQSKMVDDLIYAELSKHSRRRPSPKELPVVIHIIHQNGSENISDAMVNRGMDHLNQAFANIGYYDPATGVNTEISFCLAKTDPQGNATNGIVRINNSLTNMDASTDDLSIKNLSRWDPTKYINIWLVNEICRSGNCGVAGYAYLPAAHGRDFDGIVMESRWFGSSEANSGVTIHEMGHYLGLYHTFQDGCINNNCLQDGDRVCDTPPDQTTARVPCNATPNSCSSDVNTSDPNNPFATDQNDLFQNYMDYSDFACYSLFTEGQSERMHASIETIRASLLMSTACSDPCTAQVSTTINVTNTTVNIGSNINFTNNSVNATNFSWLIDGVEFSSNPNPNYTFNTLGTYTIVLLASGNDPNCFNSDSIMIEVVCPLQGDFNEIPEFSALGATLDLVGNNITAGADIRWVVNGQGVSNTSDYNLELDQVGNYQICLELSNGLCEYEFCRSTFVFPTAIEICDNGIDDDGDGLIDEEDEDCNCGNTFLKLIGNDGVDEKGHSIIPYKEDLILGMSVDGNSTIVRIRKSGEILWSKLVDISPQHDEHISDLIVTDNEELIVLVGASTFEDAFVFKMDLQSQTLDWSYTFPGRMIAASINEGSAADKFFISAYWRDASRGDILLYELDASTGSIELMKRQTFGQWEFVVDMTRFDDLLYGVGRYTYAPGGLANMRASFSAFDFNGNEIFSKLYFVSSNQQARLYNRAFDRDQNNNFIHGISGDRNGTSLADNPLYLMQTDATGIPRWLKSYDIQGIGDALSQDVIAVDDGYIAYGNSRSGP
ncbi:MAG: M43 family zinc metalloprotease, partial [Bacteroidota bacterium]